MLHDALISIEEGLCSSIDPYPLDEVLVTVPERSRRRQSDRFGEASSRESGAGVKGTCTSCTLGVIVQVSNAFQRVHNSFSLFIHQWTTITELRSIHKRLGEFEIAIGYKKN